MKDINCPVCNKSNTWSSDNTFRPFCSHRCKLIDLGEWASEGHRVPGEDVILDDEHNSEEDQN